MNTIIESTPAATTTGLPHGRTRRTGTWIAAAVVAVLAFVMIRGLLQNENLDLGVVGHYLFNENVIHGLYLTLILAISAEVIALVLGIPLAYGRMSANPVISKACSTYIWLFRSVPSIVQLLLWGNLALFIPHLSLSIPFTDISLFSQPTNAVVSSATAAVIALSLHDAAYNAEIFRSGIISISDGQRGAAKALGLSWWQTQRKVVLPQALRVALPTLGSQFITLLKLTSLVSVIAVGDLLTEAQNISYNNQRVIELLLVASIWFLLITSIASVGQTLLERRGARSQSHSGNGREE